MLCSLSFASSIAIEGTAGLCVRFECGQIPAGSSPDRCCRQSYQISDPFLQNPDATPTSFALQDSINDRHSRQAAGSRSSATNHSGFGGKMRVGMMTTRPNFPTKNGIELLERMKEKSFENSPWDCGLSKAGEGRRIYLQDSTVKKGRFTGRLWNWVGYHSRLDN